MFKKVLIANRGEIACRVAATARRLGIRTVAVYSDADAHAAHVHACDEAVHVGASAPRESYLQWQRILDAALATGAQAVHPGYGFLSENAAFARACQQAGLVFIGPSPESMEAMGLKAESKRLMQTAGVPLVPGYHGENQDPAFLQQQADAMGYPVLIKASAGGGGKGMRVVEASADFAAALASCQREARSSFGDDAVLIEKYVQRPRHIEIQVFGDSHGQLVHLFERDCSVQRRHQKVLEESPAPGMTPALRQAMGEAAIAAAKAVNYVGAGTVEFIVEQAAYDQPEAMRFYFMEMNTRLQVEHPVTEAVTGLDLVEWQLRVAAGQRLPLAQADIVQRGHAIEARICAENPDQQFLPATGTLKRLRAPTAVGFEVAPVRWDAGVREGDTISPFYDSMVAKLIVHGDNRAQALARLDAALAATRIVGVQTNVQFLRRVLSSESFDQARLDTALIERERAVLFGVEGLSLEVCAAAAVGHALMQARAQASHDPWSRADDWAAFGAVTRHFDLRWGEQAVVATLDAAHNGDMCLRVGAGAAQAFAVKATEQGMEVRLGAWHGVVHVEADGDHRHVFGRAGAGVVAVIDPLAHAGEDTGGGGHLQAPMPGKVLSVAVAAGDLVTKGQLLAVLEAMKMEHSITAPRDGRVGEVMVAAGDQVTDGVELLRLDEA
jgi:3-methylcrotonyl-CoA carboxylase alpha subunit